jgi:hypothetical protein
MSKISELCAVPVRTVDITGHGHWPMDALSVVAAFVATPTAMRGWLRA